MHFWQVSQLITCHFRVVCMEGTAWRSNFESFSVMVLFVKLAVRGQLFYCHTSNFSSIWKHLKVYPEKSQIVWVVTLLVDNYLTVCMEWLLLGFSAFCPFLHRVVFKGGPCPLQITGEGRTYECVVHKKYKFPKVAVYGVNKRYRRH